MNKTFCVWELKPMQHEHYNSDSVILPRGLTTIGRALDNSLRCPSTLSSRYHCEIKLLDTGLIFIRDLKSLNGTFLGSVKILPERDISLSHGDIIGIGVETTDLLNGAMCIFHLTRNVLEKNELEFRRGDVVPFNNTLSCEDPKSLNHSVTGDKTLNDTQDAGGSRLCPESNILVNHTHSKIPKDNGLTITSDCMGNQNKIDCGVNKAMVSGHQSDADILLKTDPDKLSLENNDNYVFNCNKIKHSSSRTSSTEQSKTDTLPNSVEHNLTRTEISSTMIDYSEPQYTLCPDEHTSESNFGNTTKQGVRCSKTKTLDLEINVKPELELCNVKHVFDELDKLDKNNTSSTNLLITSIMPTDIFLAPFHSQDQAAKDTSIVTNNDLSYNLPVENSSQNKKSNLEETVNASTSTTFSNKCFTAGKDEITRNNAALESLKIDKGGTVSIEHTHSKVLVGRTQEQLFCTGPNEIAEKIDNMVQSIFNRRLSHTSDSHENLNNASSYINPLETKKLTASAVPQKCTADGSISVIDCDEQFPCSKQFDRKPECESLDEHKMSNSTGKVESLVLESFTIDDDIILIDDDDLLPCSQMFDVKHAAFENAVDDSDVPILDIIDEDYISDADSSDEWFQRLSQCDPLNIKTLEDDYNFNSENNSVERCKIKAKDSVILDSKFKNKQNTSSEDSINHTFLEIKLDVNLSDENDPESKILKDNYILEEKFQNVNSLLEQSFVESDSFPISRPNTIVTNSDKLFDSNLNNMCLKSPNSKNKRKHDSSKSISDNLLTDNQLDQLINQHLPSKKMKQTHLRNASSPVKDNADDLNNKRSSKKLFTSKDDKLHSPNLNKRDENKTKGSSIENDGSQCVLKSFDGSLKERQNKENKATIKHEFLNVSYSGCEHKSDVLHQVLDVNLCKTTKDSEEPSWKHLIEEIVMFSNQWDESVGYAKTRDLENQKLIITDTSSQLKEKDDFQREEHFQLIVGTKSSSVSNDLNTPTSRATVRIPKESPGEAKLMSRTINDCRSYSIKKLGNYNSKLHSAQETKLDAIQKKISGKYKKKPTPVVGPKALPVKNKQLLSPYPRLKQNKTEFPHHVINASKSKPSSSKSIQLSSKAPSSSTDKKAYRKSKLSEIANKTNIQQQSITKTKLGKSLNNRIKNTHKNRSEMFLDHLVSSDNSSKEERSADKGKQKSNIFQYKIPRRNFISNHTMESDALNNESGSKQVYETTSVVNKSDVNKNDKSDEIQKIIQPKAIMMNLGKTKESINHGVDKIFKNNVPACRKTDATSMSDTGGKKEQSYSGIEYELNDKEKLIQSVIGRLKPIIKLSNGESTLNNKTRKKVRFTQGDENNLVVITQYIEIAEGSSLKPITKHIAKKDTPPRRKCLNNSLQMAYFNYFEETLHLICKWNTLWFQEKNKCKGEPPVFTGQIYHMKDSFNGYSDYRRSIFPLMLHELWALLARQHDQIQHRNKPFIIEIQHKSIKPVTNRFFPIQKDGEKRTLCRLECQILLEKSNQSSWPRLSDLVVLDVRMKGLKDESFKHRILGYIFVSNIRAISSHPAVSPKLKAENVKASLVMDLSMFIREERYKIDTTQESRIAVLKNIRPEMRLFNALDCLSTSSMLNIICQPSTNNLELPLRLDMDKSTHQIIYHMNTSQKKAVTNVASACVTNTDMIHFIHGPPGCGKSEVIIGIIQMIFLAHIQKKLTEPPQILLCAPSNAAIDDIFMRLMEYRNKFKKCYLNQKIKMIRIGRTDFTHKNVRSMTLDYLVEKDLKTSRDILEDEQSRLIELKTLEAKKNQLNYQLENLGSKINDATFIRNVEIKLADTIKRMKELEKGKNQKPLEGKELKEKKKERELLFLEGANIIASTLSSCYNAQMEAAQLNKKLRLTCCIVDEATQCTEPEVLIPLMLGVRQLVLVGDPRQLPATVLSSTAKEHGLDRSLFARHRDWWLREKSDGLPKSRYHFLDTQYRMHPDIVKWPSEYFYNSSIKSHDSLEARSLSHPLLHYVILSHSFTQSNHEECNYEEVTLVEILVQAINASGLCTDRSIGIITPYSRQKELLRRKLHPDIEVGTVDSFQGRERDIIILSCVRTEGVGFMSGMERLNVALTRARYSLIICGNFKSLQGDPTWASLLQDAKIRGVFKTVATFYRSKDLFHAISKPTYL